MSKRKQLGNKIRFEVFKRDKFTCQYCGKKSPDIVLNVDHIKPVSKGGTNDIINLITSCFECNSGKKDVLLSDDSEITKKQKQLESIQERKNQLEMMYEWQMELLNIDEDIIVKICEIWDHITGYEITETGINNNIRPLLSRYSFDEIIESMKISVSQYYKQDKDGSINKALNYIEKICRNKKLNLDKPYMKDLFYHRGILRNRLSYIVEWEAIKMLEEMYLSGVELSCMRSICENSNSWSEFKQDYNDVMGEQ